MQAAVSSDSNCNLLASSTVLFRSVSLSKSQTCTILAISNIYGMEPEDQTSYVKTVCCSSILSLPLKQVARRKGKIGTHIPDDTTKLQGKLWRLFFEGLKPLAFIWDCAKWWEMSINFQTFPKASKFTLFQLSNWAPGSPSEDHR